MAGIGEVDITLNGKLVTLRSSLKAGKLISGYEGGFQGAFKKLGAFDQDFYAFVVAAGLGKRPNEVEDDVYATGLPNISEALGVYVGYLVNGGKPLATTDDKSGEG